MTLTRVSFQEEQCHKVTRYLAGFERGLIGNNDSSKAISTVRCRNDDLAA